MFKRMIILCIILFSYGCEKPMDGWNKYVHSKDAVEAQKSITPDLLNQHISTLASDEFEGRTLFLPTRSDFRYASKLTCKRCCSPLGSEYMT